MSVLYASSFIFFFTLEISTAEPIFYIDTSKKADTYAGFMELLRSEEVNRILIDLGKIHHVKSVTLTGSNRNAKPTITFYGISLLTTQTAFHMENVTDSKYIFNFNSPIRIMFIESTEKLLGVEINSYETKIERYLGCFKIKNFTNIAAEYIHSLKDFNECHKICNYEYIGYKKDNKTCLCMHDIKNMISHDLQMCNTSCSDSGVFCGGKDAFSVFGKNPQIYGHVEENRLLQHFFRSADYPKCDEKFWGYNCSNINCGHYTCGDNKECNYPTIGGRPIYFGICTCKNGYSLDNDHSCKDVDECQNATVCEKTFNCNNTKGSYLCTCSWGYENQSGVCGDINECLGELYCAIESTICTNNQGSYECLCKPGYDNPSPKSEIPALCTDVDECRMQRHNCDENSTYCSNRPGFFTCDCKSGFLRRGTSICEDIDECTELNHNCGKEAECINAIGSYKCACPNGSNENAFNYAVECQDKDECLEPNSCNASLSFCLNMRFTYLCLCFPGYTNIDNFTCGPASPTKHGNVTLSTSDYWSTTVIIDIKEAVYDFIKTYGPIIVGLCFVLVLTPCLLFIYWRTSNRSFQTTLSTLTE